MLTDLADVESKKRHRKGFQGLDDTHDFCDKSFSFKIQKKNPVTRNPEFMPQISELIELSNSFLMGKSYFELTEPVIINTLPSTE